MDQRIRQIDFIGCGLTGLSGRCRLVTPLFNRVLILALAQKTYDTHLSSERAALKELLSSLKLDCVGLDPSGYSAGHSAVFWWCLEQEADVLLTVRSNQKTLHRQISCQFEGKRQIPHATTDQDKRHGRDTTWELRAKEAPEHIKANWPGSVWIVEVITSTTIRKGPCSFRRHLFLATFRTAQMPCCAIPEALER